MGVENFMIPVCRAYPSDSDPLDILRIGMQPIRDSYAKIATRLEILKTNACCDKALLLRQMFPDVLS